MSWVQDVFVGAFASGVNAPTYVLLNVVIACGYGTLLLLLFFSFSSRPDLTPHIFVMLLLATGLWVSINWLIGTVGLVDAKQQHEQLMGGQQGKEESESTEQIEGEGLAAGASEHKKEK